jgi:hypothetical protein
MIESFDVTDVSLTELLKPPENKSIQLLGFWVELESEWELPNYFSFRFGNSDKDLFKKSSSGIAAINLTGMEKYTTLPPNVPLNAYISGGTKRVHITLVYKIV